MKKTCLLIVSFSYGHYLPNVPELEIVKVKKSIDNDDSHFQSLCPSLQYCQAKSINCAHCKNIENIKKIDREDFSSTADYLLQAQNDCAGSISRFRQFANNFSEVL